MVANSVEIRQNIYQNIFGSFTYGNLSGLARKEVRTVVNTFLENGDIPQLNGNRDLINAMFESQFTTRPEVRRTALYSLQKLIPNDVTYSRSRQKVKEDRLFFHLYHHLMRYAALKSGTDTVMSKDTELAECAHYIELCVEFLNKEKGPISGEVLEKTKNLKPEQSSFTLYFLEKREDEQDSDYLIRQAKRLNEVRLFWLWVRLALEILVAQVAGLLLTVTLIAGVLSWALYIAFAIIFIVGVLENIFYASDDAQAIDALERTKSHMLIRLYGFINYSVWGFANLACFFWLTGTAGNIATTGLLVMDLQLTINEYIEKLASYNNSIDTYNQNMDNLFSKIADTEVYEQNKRNLKNLKKEEISNYIENATNSVDRELLWRYVDDLQSPKNNCEKEWNTQQKYHDNDKEFFRDMILGFFIYSGFHLDLFWIVVPPPIMIAGAIFLVLVSIRYKTKISIMQDIDATEDILEHRNELKGLFRKYQTILNRSPEDEPQLHQIYLQILKECAEIGYKEDCRLFKQVEFARETLSRILIPTAIILTVLFASATTAGIPTYFLVILGAAIATAIVVDIIKQRYTPKETNWETNTSNATDVSSKTLPVPSSSPPGELNSTAIAKSTLATENAAGSSSTITNNANNIPAKTSSEAKAGSTKPVEDPKRSRKNTNPSFNIDDYTIFKSHIQANNRNVNDQVISMISTTVKNKRIGNNKNLFADIKIRESKLAAYGV